MSNLYSHQEGNFSFLYYPLTGYVTPANGYSSYRCIEHFSRRKFEIDWSKSNIPKLRIFITLPEHLTEEESLDIIKLTQEGLYDLETAEKKKARDKIISANWNKEEECIITESYLSAQMEYLLSYKMKDRQKIVDAFNRYNIEDHRPNHPMVVVSTKTKKVIVAEGKKVLYHLFEQGKLIKCTKDELKLKKEKYDV